MSFISKQTRALQPIRREANSDQQRTTKRNMSTQQKASVDDKAVVCNGSETKRGKVILDKCETRSDKSAASEKRACEAREERAKRDIEIRDHVFEIRLPGVKITHCNFGKTQMEVWYVTEGTDSEKIEEELQKKIGSNIEPYKLKLVKKAGLPTFKYTSPGQSTILGKLDGCIGAYVTLIDRPRRTDAVSRTPNLHALVCGHGKKPGDVIYSGRNPERKIGVVRVAEEGETESRDRFDIGLVCLDDQQRDHHETSVTMNGARIQLAAAEDALSQEDLDNDQQVMLFNNANTRGRIFSRNYNSDTQGKFGMIAIVQRPGPGVDTQAVHGMNESGTLVVALAPHQETEAREREVEPMRAVGMLVGVESTQPTESISLAVPIDRNLMELMKHDYCENKEIQFA